MLSTGKSLRWMMAVILVVGLGTELGAWAGKRRSGDVDWSEYMDPNAGKDLPVPTNTKPKVAGETEAPDAKPATARKGRHKKAKHAKAKRRARRSRHE